MFVGLSVPHFDMILSLIGGSTNALVNLIFPPLFYYLLSRQRTPSAAYGSLPSYAEEDHTSASNSKATTSHHIQKSGHWIQVDIPLHEKVMLFEIILIGIVGGASSTYFSFAALIKGDSEFTVPCYMNISVGLPS